MRYKYTSQDRDVVAVIDDDGKSRMSMVASQVPEGAEIEEPDMPTKDELYEELWEAASKYHNRRIDGVGMAAIVGCKIDASMKSKGNAPAEAIMAWSETFWGDYELRRAVIEAGGIPSFDFSNHGNPPARVADAIKETKK
jgi:hypothetical protein